MQDAEQIACDIEDFYERFRAHTPVARRKELAKLAALRMRLHAICRDEYVLEKWGYLEGVCKQLARLRQPSGFDEGTVRAQGLGDVGNIRSRMTSLGLVQDHRDKVQ